MCLVQNINEKSYVMLKMGLLDLFCEYVYNKKTPVGLEPTLLMDFHVIEVK